MNKCVIVQNHLPVLEAVHSNMENPHIVYHLPLRLCKRLEPKLSWMSLIRQETQNMLCVKPNNW